MDDNNKGDTNYSWNQLALNHQNANSDVLRAITVNASAAADKTYSLALDADVAYRPTDANADICTRSDFAWFGFAYKYEPGTAHTLPRPTTTTVTAGAFQRA